MKNFVAKIIALVATAVTKIAPDAIAEALGTIQQKCADALAALKEGKTVDDVKQTIADLANMAVELGAAVVQDQAQGGESAAGEGEQMDAAKLASYADAQVAKALAEPRAKGMARLAKLQKALVAALKNAGDGPTVVMVVAKEDEPPKDQPAGDGTQNAGSQNASSAGAPPPIETAKHLASLQARIAKSAERPFTGWPGRIRPEKRGARA